VKTFHVSPISENTSSTKFQNPLSLIPPSPPSPNPPTSDRCRHEHADQADRFSFPLPHEQRLSTTSTSDRHPPPNRSSNADPAPKKHKEQQEASIAQKRKQIFESIRIQKPKPDLDPSNQISEKSNSKERDERLRKPEILFTLGEKEASHREGIE
jgi:hypothetical protein